MKQKKKKHFSKPHRTNDLVMRDMHGVAKFKRTGWGVSWQDTTMIFDYVLIKKFRCGEKWMSNFHNLIGVYYDRFEKGEITLEDLEAYSWEYAGIKIKANEITEKDVLRITQNKYLRMVGIKNLERNNEILELQVIHSMCGICALHEMGWKEGYINRWQSSCEQLMKEIYSGSNPEVTRANFIFLEKALEQEGYGYEEIFDWYEDERKKRKEQEEKEREERRTGNEYI